MFRCDLLVLATSFSKHLESCSPKELTCDQCNYSTTFKKELKKHEKLHHIGLHCELCNKYFSTTTKLENHENQVHQKRLECDICKKSFSSRKTLNSHKQLKHGSQDKLHKCSKCDRTCLSAAKLRRHEKIHERQKVDKYLCSECGFTGADMKIMNDHFKNLHPKKIVLTKRVAQEWFDSNTTSNRGLLFLAKPLRYSTTVFEVKHKAPVNMFVHDLIRLSFPVVETKCVID